MCAMTTKTKIKYLKPALSFQEQLEQLKDRGLIVNNEEEALITLSNISYYRLSAYWIPFKKRDKQGNLLNQFQDNIFFENIIELYEFDRKLRLHIMDALERIEISIRTHITYHLAHHYGAFALEKSENFHNKFEHKTWLLQIQNEIIRSKEPFIEHFMDKYEGFPTLPVWMATEVTSFGSLSFLYKGLKNEDKRVIAETQYNLHPKTLANFLHFLTYVRNICAHHGRLWNKELAIRPKLDGLDQAWLPPITPRSDRSFFILLILKYLLNHSDKTQQWAKSYEELILPILAKYKWSASSMGIPNNWQNHLLWN
ncbi:AbiD phage protein-like [Legionella cherrii]|uniref:AbiD phage protein-like n=2 Tax=Legionella cherrii TaxID=28084 RepID=A0ABY6T612_9GAMM|nr:AbiD phage protein-like [Legionella cherrii]